ncbi:MAG: hypothetical protein COA99_03200 [Moraxellaceae bacterium]|nr:MAG: hypothetical protein COA99_03200 [Moraxellaceae bacterium]
MYNMLSHSHSGLAYLLFLFALVSLLLAVLLKFSPSPRWLSIAKVTRVVETALMGLIALSGLAALFMGNWPLVSLWPWLALVVVFIHGKVGVKRIKPLQLNFDDSDAQGKSQLVMFALVQCLLVVAVIALMHIKPF